MKRYRTEVEYYYVRDSELYDADSEMVEDPSGEWVRYDDVVKVLDFARSFADEPCEYGDNCPTFETNHYQCYNCRAREALSEVQE